MPHALRFHVPVDTSPWTLVQLPALDSTFMPQSPRVEQTSAHAEAVWVDELQIVLSFDIEEHFRIEAAAGLQVDSALRTHYAERIDHTTRWLLEVLAERSIKATFFVVGQIARDNPRLIRAIHDDGHELASHSWSHRRLHHLTPAEFREDLHMSKDSLEQVTGAAVVGYRAPTFSLVRETAWAIDVLTELGMRYDSSIYPIRHDRYGVPGAPRSPFLAHGNSSTILELPALTMRVLGMTLPVGGGGYFRLLPLSFTARALVAAQKFRLAVAMLYFHPWEFDPDQPRLALSWLNGFRTYVGITRSRERLLRLLGRHRFMRAIDVAAQLQNDSGLLPRFNLATRT